MLRAAVATGTEFGLPGQGDHGRRAARPRRDHGGHRRRAPGPARRRGRAGCSTASPAPRGRPRTWSSWSAPDGIDLAINLEVPEDVVVERISGRRVCSSCGTIYSVGSTSPPTTGVVRQVRRRGRAARRRHRGGRAQAPGDLRRADGAADRLVRRAGRCWSPSTASAIPTTSPTASSRRSTQRLAASIAGQRVGAPGRTLGRRHLIAGAPMPVVSVRSARAAPPRSPCHANHR